MRYYGCVWLGGQPLAWLPGANFGLFGCLEVGWGLAKAGHPYPFSLARIERPNRSFNWSQVRASPPARYPHPRTPLTSRASRAPDLVAGEECEQPRRSRGAPPSRAVDLHPRRESPRRGRPPSRR